MAAEIQDTGQLGNWSAGKLVRQPRGPRLRPGLAGGAETQTGRRAETETWDGCSEGKRRSSKREGGGRFIFRS